MEAFMETRSNEVSTSCIVRSSSEKKNLGDHVGWTNMQTSEKKKTCFGLYKKQIQFCSNNTVKSHLHSIL